MSNITFSHPYFLYLLLLLIPLIGWYIWKQNTANASLQISTLKGFAGTKPTLKVYLRHVPFALRSLAFGMLIIVLARPQSTNSKRNVVTEGIDIVIAMDISGSMQAMDFKPNRLEAAKNVAIEFLAGRGEDKVGLVVFAGQSFTQCPLTTDHTVLTNLFKDIQLGLIKEEGTAIGLGLATAVNRIKDSDAKSKVVILLSDGENNKGEVAPLTAADIAKTFGVRVYTIGVGTIGMAPYPIKTVFGQQIQEVEVKIDEEMLTEIADITGGKYFRATDNAKLKEIYEEIDQMEKTKIKVQEYTKRSEEFYLFALLAAIFVFLEVLLKNTVLRNLP